MIIPINEEQKKKAPIDRSLCTRCGRCCYLMIDGKPVKCKHLVKLKSGTTLCRIYKKRIGEVIGQGFKCGYIEASPYDYKECPFNTGRPLFNGGKPYDNFD